MSAGTAALHPASQRGAAGYASEVGSPRSAHVSGGPGNTPTAPDGSTHATSGGTGAEVGPGVPAYGGVETSAPELHSAAHRSSAWRAVSSPETVTSGPSPGWSKSLVTYGKQWATSRTLARWKASIATAVPAPATTRPAPAATAT